MWFRCVRSVSRFYCNSSISTHVNRFSYSPSLLPHRGSSLHASSRFRCFCSVSVDLKTESAKENESRSAINWALDSVVKIFSYSNEPTIAKPWQTDEKESSGSGFAILGSKILTNAHVMDNNSYVLVRKHGSSTKYKAKVEAFGYDCDLATLLIDSEEFWKDLNPLELGDIPFIGDTVFALGYPRGGETISVTKGIVSRVEPRKYSHGSSGIKLLSIQIDAAINDGNYGGPVVMGNKVAGVAFESSDSPSSENINYIIPTPVIKHFLSGVEKTGQYYGLCSLDITYQCMEDAQLRKHFKMSDTMTGILINEINSLSCAKGILKMHDVVLAIDGVSIENDETIPFRKKERISFTYLVPLKKPGETVLLKVLRKGKEHELDIILRPVNPLVPNRYLPSYYIFAGFVFMSLSKPYIRSSSNICECPLKREANQAGEQIVIISQVLLNDITIGYRDFIDCTVKKVNGEDVLNLRHLIELVENCSAQDLRLDLENEGVIFVDYKSAKEATALILERHGIRSAMSKDLKKETSELVSATAG